MDGVIVLTEHLKANAHAQAVRAFGGYVPAQFYAGIMGGSRSTVRAAFIKEAGLDIDPGAYAKIYDEVFRQSIFTEMQIVEGGTELLARLKETQYVLALVTSSIRWMMDTVLSHTGLGKFFDVTICADDVQREKPAPDPYLLALERLKLPASAATVIEDSETGIAAAKTAGVPVIAVRHNFNRLHDFSDADTELDSLQDTDRVIESIEKLF